VFRIRPQGAATGYLNCWCDVKVQVHILRKATVSDPFLLARDHEGKPAWRPVRCSIGPWA